MALKHNIKNAMAATSVAKLMQIRKATIQEVYLISKVWNTVLKKYENPKCTT
jgi:UDP-N-acetylmuramyl pentapeptide synthase